MEYKMKTREYRAFFLCLILGTFLFANASLSASQTKADEKTLQELIDEATGPTTIDLKGKTYTIGLLEFRDKNDITLTNGRLIQYSGYNNSSFIYLRSGSSLTLENITISGTDYPNKATFICILENASLVVKEGTRIDKVVAAGNVDGSCAVVYAGGAFKMTGGEIYGNSDVNIRVEAGASFEMTGGTTGGIFAKDNIRFGGDAKIMGRYATYDDYCRLLIVSALKNDLEVYKAGKIGTIVASGVDDYLPTKSDLAKFSHKFPKEYGFALKDNNIVLAEPKPDDKPIKTEDELTEKIDELPAGTEDAPSEVVVGTEIPLTKPVDVNDKYIDLGGGGTLTSQNSDAAISVNKGGLTLNDVVVKADWTTTSPLLHVTNGGYLNIGADAQVVSKSDYLGTILVDSKSSIMSEGLITGHISNSGSLTVKEGLITGQISSFSPFKLSGKVPVTKGIYLGQGQGIEGLIGLMESLRSPLNVLVDQKLLTKAASSVVVMEGVDGYTLTKSDLSKLVCFTDDCEFVLFGNQILMQAIDHTANEQINRESLQLRISGRDIRVEGVPAGQPYGLYDLSGTLLSDGVSDGGTISLSVSRPGIYIFHVAGIGKKIQISR